jgi:hypothetical protein
LFHEEEKEKEEEEEEEEEERRRGGGGGGGDGIFGVSCGCGDVSFSVFPRLVVGVDGILVYLADVGMQVFLCFQDDEEVGMQVFRMRRRSEWNVLRMWGLRGRMWGTM